MVKYTQKKSKKARVPTPEEREHAPLLQEVAAAVTRVKRRDTEQSFELGEHLARAKAVLPEKALGAWVKENCSFTPRLARAYIAVHVNLQEVRSRLVAAVVKPTILLALASADPEKVEEVVTAIEADGRLSVVEVKRMLKADADAQDQADVAVGGRRGLMRAAQEKLKSNATLFVKHAKLVLKEVETAVIAFGSGKHIAKTALFDKLGQQAGLAHDHLAAAVETDADQDWRKVRIVLGRLSDLPRWPGKSEFQNWLLNEVLPALRFAVLGMPLEAGPEPSLINDEASPEATAKEVVIEKDEVLVELSVPVSAPAKVPPAVIAMI